MGNLYCSIGGESIIAELIVNGRHQLHFFEEAYETGEDLYHIFEKQLIVNEQAIDSIYISSPVTPAYLLRTEDVELFQQRNAGLFKVRSYPFDSSHSLVYKLPSYIKLITSFQYPVYFIPSMECFKSSLESNTKEQQEDGFLFTFLVEDVLHILYYANGKNVVATVFECEAATDALYYSMLVIEEQGMKAEDVDITVGGRGDNYDEAKRLLKKYADIDSGFFQTLDESKYFDLKALKTCV